MKSPETVGELPVPKEIRRKGAWILFDLDGVILRWVNTHIPDAGHQTQMLTVLKAAKEAGVGIAVLTNRPPGQMPAIAYELGIDYGIWVTESGGSVYDVHNHLSHATAQWVPWIDRVQYMRDILTIRAGIPKAPTSFDSPQFEPGMGYIKTVLVVPPGMSAEDVAANTIVPTLVENGFDRWFSVTVGKGIDIDPIGLSKAQGMEYLLEANDIDAGKTPVLWIADAKRDVAAASVLACLGGTVAAVGNADAVYREFVASMGGIIAPEMTSYHSSVVHIVETFLKTV